MSKRCKRPECARTRSALAALFSGLRRASRPPVYSDENSLTLYAHKFGWLRGGVDGAIKNAFMKRRGRYLTRMSRVSI
jgi:hypothetical protein